MKLLLTNMSFHSYQVLSLCLYFQEISMVLHLYDVVIMVAGLYDCVFLIAWKHISATIIILLDFMINAFS